MANTKKVIQDWSETGKTVYCVVRRESDNAYLQSADGSFSASISFNPMTENPVMKGRYELSESRMVWIETLYTIAAYKQGGGSPNPASDAIIGSGETYIVNDISTDAIMPSPPPANMQNLFGNVRRLNWAVAAGDIVTAAIAANQQLVNGSLMQDYNISSVVDVNGNFVLVVPCTAEIVVSVPGHGSHEITISSVNGSVDIALYVGLTSLDME